MANLPVIRNLSGIAAAVSRAAGKLYAGKPSYISGVDISNWPSAGQPVAPMGPPQSQPLSFPFTPWQNLNFTPRSDAAYDADTLRYLSCYPLARILIENTKDQICQTDWTINLRKMPGETQGDIKARRKKEQKGDENISILSRFFEYPNPENNWQEWLRRIVDDMLVVDAASILVARDKNNKIAELHYTDGGQITRYVNDKGLTPQPPSPAYAQIYQGVPRVELTTDELIYKPRNIVPRKTMASYLYGYGPTEQLAEEIKVGIGRLAYVLAFYEKGSLGNILHIVPPRVDPEKIREAMNFINSVLSGNADQKRMWTMIQGFGEDGKDDQIIVPKEPVLADTFDDVHIRKLAFGYGAAPQRLQRPMNRGSAVASQQAATEEGIMPYLQWVKGVVDYIIQIKLGFYGYCIEFDTDEDLDEVRQSQADERDIKNGLRTRNEVRQDRGYDADPNQMADKLTVTLPNGVIELGDDPIQLGGGDPSRSNLKLKPKLNGKKALVMRGSDEQHE